MKKTVCLIILGLYIAIAGVPAFLMYSGIQIPHLYEFNSKGTHIYTVCANDLSEKVRYSWGTIIALTPFLSLLGLIKGK